MGIKRLCVHQRQLIATPRALEKQNSFSVMALFLWMTGPHPIPDSYDDKKPYDSLHDTGITE
jgi:hypothetical protein